MNKCSIPNIKSSSYALYCSCWIHSEAAMLKSNILGPLKKKVECMCIIKFDPKAIKKYKFLVSEV